MSTPSDPAQASVIRGQVNSLLGQAEETIGVLAGSKPYIEAGESLKDAGTHEVETARAYAKGEAAVDKVTGKVQSAVGMLTGDQDTQTEGNMRAQEADLKKHAAEGTLPQMDLESLKGKAQSAMGMVTGDTELQKEGNIRHEKAEWGLGGK